MWVFVGLQQTISQNFWGWGDPDFHIIPYSYPLSIRIWRSLPQPHAALVDALLSASTVTYIRNSSTKTDEYSLFLTNRSYPHCAGRFLLPLPLRSSSPPTTTSCRRSPSVLSRSSPSPVRPSVRSTLDNQATTQP